VGIDRNQAHRSCDGHVREKVHQAQRTALAAIVNELHVRACPFFEGLASLVDHNPHLPDGDGQLLAVQERDLELLFYRRTI